MKQEEQIKYGEILKKMEALKAGGSLDLSTEEDLAIAIMNLISLEEICSPKSF